MPKVYVNCVKLRKESDVRVFATSRKDSAIEFKEQYEELEERRCGTVTINKMRTINF